MMPAKELAQHALLVLRILDKLGPIERSEVLHVAGAIVAIEVARLSRPTPVRDE